MSGIGTTEDVEQFLARPLTAYLATAGPHVRPVWYLWEDRAFWVISGPWSRAPRDIEADSSVALAIATTTVETGEVKQVLVRGRAELVPWDEGRGFRLLSKYLGDDIEEWDDRFSQYLRGAPDCVWIRISVGEPRLVDLSFEPSSASPLDG